MAKVHASKRFMDKSSRVVTYVILTVISIVWLFPFFYLILQSFADIQNPAYNTRSIIPNVWTLNNYKALFTDSRVPFFNWWLNTLIIAFFTAVLQTILVLMTSYALSRLRFKGRQGLMKLILILGMFPGFLGMLVIYYILELLHLNTSIYSLILVYTASSAMSYYVAKGFFDTIPKSLDEAVMIDGGTKNTVFWRIILPLSKPIIIYTALMAFTGPWMDFIFAKVIIGDGNPAMWTVSIGLYQMVFANQITTPMFTIFAAGCVVVAIPIVTLFMFLQKYYVEGVTAGAVKG